MLALQTTFKNMSFYHRNLSAFEEKEKVTAAQKLFSLHNLCSLCLHLDLYHLDNSEAH